MKIAALYSGGKDSTYCIKWAMDYGHSVECLLTIHPKTNDSYMYHVPNIWITDYTSECLGIPLLKRDSSGIKEKELEDLEAILVEAKEKYNIEGVVSGAIASNYQKSRVDAICERLGLKSLAPLWGMDQEEAIMMEIDSGMDIRLVGVYAEGLDHKWLGRQLTKKAIQEIKDKKYISVVGEGGEFESLVVDAPFFKKRLVIDEAEKHWEDDRGTLILKKVHVEEKN